MFSTCHANITGQRHDTNRPEYLRTRIPWRIRAAPGNDAIRSAHGRRPYIHLSCISDASKSTVVHSGVNALTSALRNYRYLHCYIQHTPWGGCYVTNRLPNSADPVFERSWYAESELVTNEYVTWGCNSLSSSSSFGLCAFVVGIEEAVGTGELHCRTWHSARERTCHWRTESSSSSTTGSDESNEDALAHTTSSAGMSG